MSKVFRENGGRTLRSRAAARIPECPIQPHIPPLLKNPPALRLLPNLRTRALFFSLATVCGPDGDSPSTCSSFSSCSASPSTWHGPTTLAQTASGPTCWKSLETCSPPLFLPLYWLASNAAPGNCTGCLSPRLSAANSGPAPHGDSPPSAP